MKQKPNLVRQMWFVFGIQIAFSITLIAVCVAPALICLQAQEKSNQATAILVPKVHQEIQAEQDPAKLRRMATEFVDETVTDGTERESGLRLLVKVSICYGVTFLLLCSFTGICAYKLQREERSKLPLSDSK
jgi:hypothetical protein